MISYCGEPQDFFPFDLVSNSTVLSSVFGSNRTSLAFDAKNLKHYILLVDIAKVSEKTCAEISRKLIG
jgi:hypothetical protein